MEYIYIILIAVAAITVVVGTVKVTKRIRYKISRAKRMVSNLILQNGISAIQDEIIEETPKSVSGMTRICLPRILKDFPDFDYSYFRQLTENLIKGIFSSINNGNVDYLDNAADSLKEQVKFKIKENLSSGENKKYKEVKIHKTEIMSYDRNNGLYTITFQSAVEYILSEIKVQTKYNVELAYIQDEEKLSTHESENILGSVCPNCGAPIKTIQNNCEYCGSLLTTINIRSWKYVSYNEV